MYIAYNNILYTKREVIKMETTKQLSCADLVDQKYQDEENDLKAIKDYFDDFETLNEGEQIAKRKRQKWAVMITIITITFLIT